MGALFKNSKKAQNAFQDIGAHLFCIPARSPDLNPIKNIFHLVDKSLRKKALDKQISEESKEELFARVRSTLLNYSKDTIDKIISSMDKRIEAVIAIRG